MASSRKRPSGELIAEVGRFLGSIDLRGKRLAVGLSGGVDSVVLLHVSKQHPELNLSAIHVHHGLSPNAGAWAQFCRAEEHTSELQSQSNLVCRLLLEKKK